MSEQKQFEKQTLLSIIDTYFFYAVLFSAIIGMPVASVILMMKYA